MIGAYGSPARARGSWRGRFGVESAMEDQGVVVVDIHGKIHLWSTGAERLFGFPAVEAVGESLDLIIPEKMRERHWAGFRRAMRDGSSGGDGAATRLPVVRKDGTVLAVPVRFVFLRDAADRAVGAVGIFATHV
jgi:PAS domain S-box-containing protein